MANGEECYFTLGLYGKVHHIQTIYTSIPTIKFASNVWRFYFYLGGLRVYRDVRAVIAETVPSQPSTHFAAAAATKEEALNEAASRVLASSCLQRIQNRRLVVAQCAIQLHLQW